MINKNKKKDTSYIYNASQISSKEKTNKKIEKQQFVQISKEMKKP